MQGSHIEVVFSKLIIRQDEGDIYPVVTAKLNDDAKSTDVSKQSTAGPKYNQTFIWNETEFKKPELEDSKITLEVWDNGRT